MLQPQEEGLPRCLRWPQRCAALVLHPAQFFNCLLSVRADPLTRFAPSPDCAALDECGVCGGNGKDKVSLSLPWACPIAVLAVAIALARWHSLL